MERAIPELKTSRLLLRHIAAADIDKIYAGLSDPDIIQFYGVSYKSLNDTKQQMDFYQQQEENNTGKFWVVCDAEHLEFMGVGGLNNLQQAHRKAEIGFWLLKDFWGKGIMAEAVSLICDYAFREMGLHRIEGFVEPENVNCKSALTKIGFRHEGCMRDCEIKNEQFISLDIYAKLHP